MSAKTKNAAAKKAKAKTAPTKKNVANGKTKTPAKKAASPSKNLKNKGSNIKKAKSVTAASAPKAKASGGVKAKSPGSSNKQNTTSKKSAKHAQQRIAAPIMPAGKDQHFIPVHTTQQPTTIHNSVQEEKQFHQREEVALNQENQKVKAVMATRMGRKRIFPIQRKG